MPENPPQENEAIKKESEKAEAVNKAANLRKLTENEKSFLRVLLIIISAALIFSAGHYLFLIKPPVKSPASRVAQPSGQQSRPGQLSNQIQQWMQYQRRLEEQRYQSRQIQQQLAGQSKDIENTSPIAPSFETTGPTLRQKYIQTIRGSLDSRCYSGCIRQWGEDSIAYCQSACRY